MWKLVFEISVYRFGKEEVLAKGVCERIGIDGTLTYAKEGHAKETVDKDMPTHTEAIRYVLDALMDSSKGVIKSLSEVDAVGHRVVHGGENSHHLSLLMMP